MTEKKLTKKEGSFKGWNLWKFLKGRKKTIVTIVGSICGYFALSQDLTGLIVGPVLEGIWAVAEFYFKKMELK
jgi:hypothetical protein